MSRSAATISRAAGLALCVLLLQGAAGAASAQLINNRLDVYLGPGAGWFHGPEHIVEGDFTYPAFYPGLQQALGISGGASWALSGNMYLGAGLEQVKGARWQMEGENLYHDSQCMIFQVSPYVKYMSGRKEQGFRNRFRWALEAGPTVGNSVVSLNDSIFSDTRTTVPGSDPAQDKENLYGFRLALGLDFSLNQHTGFFLRWAFNYSLIPDPWLYPDKHLVRSGLEAGISYRVAGDKRFFLRTP